MMRWGGDKLDQIFPVGAGFPEVKSQTKFKLSFLFSRLYLSAPTQVRRRPLSAVGYKRPISQYAQMAVASATGAPSRYQVSAALTSRRTVGRSAAENEM